MKEVRKKTIVTEGFPDDTSSKILSAYKHTLVPCQIFASSPLENLQVGVINQIIPQ